jgi:hypothetical protein
MEAVQNIVNGKLAMDASKDLVEWKQQNPYIASLVSVARKAAVELELVDEND